MHAGGDGGVRGPGEACAAECAGQGRQRRVRPALIAVGGRVWLQAAERRGTGRRRGKKKEGVRSAEKWNDDGNWMSGQRKNSGRGLGFRIK